MLFLIQEEMKTSNFDKLLERLNKEKQLNASLLNKQHPEVHNI